MLDVASDEILYEFIKIILESFNGKHRERATEEIDPYDNFRNNNQ